MNLPPIAEKFVTHFGEMSGPWGINRTSARVFALLYLSPEPMHALELCDALGISRSHASSALKELLTWRLIKLVHKPKDRRDHFTVIDNVWDIARILIEERRKREFEPTVGALGEIVKMKPHTGDDRAMHEKIKEMHNLMGMISEWYSDVQQMETKKLVRLLKLGSGIYSLYSKAGKITNKKG